MKEGPKINSLPRFHLKPVYERTTMKSFELPKDQWKPAWGALFGAIPVAWIFRDPWQQQASPLEWGLTILVFAVFLVLYTFYVIYWSRRQWLLYVCLGMAILAIAFTAYRPSGVTFFIFVAAIGPLAVGGKIPHSIAIIVGTSVLLGLEWWLLWPLDLMPFVVGILSVLLGAGTTFAARQQIDHAQAHRRAERERIARDLHDILGHTLSVIIVKSELAGRLLQTNSPRVATEVNDIELLARKALDEVREAISGYQSGDLWTEIKRTKAVLESADISLELQCDEVMIPAAQERVLILVLREAITNILRHAKARRCQIAVKMENAELLLRVADDGIGDTHNKEGFGKHGIRERLAAIGGKVLWEGSTQGTVVAATVPLDNAP